MVLGVGLAVLALGQTAVAGPQPVRRARGIFNEGDSGSVRTSEPIRAGEVVVKLKVASVAAELELNSTQGRASSRQPGLGSLLARFRVERAERVFRGHSSRLDRTLVLRAPGLDETGTRALVQALRADPAVAYAEPNVILHALATPNDPFYATSASWGQGFDDMWGLRALEAGAAWSITRGAGVVVAVVDTGVDYTHADLATNVWTNPGEIGLDALGRDKRSNGVDDDGDGYVDDWHGWDFTGTATAQGDSDATDDHGHGTHVSGIIAAVADNAIGITGVAPAARVLAVKALDANGSGALTQISEAIRYAADRGAKVINLSLGGWGETPQTMADAVAYAHDVRGAVVVAASGNSNVDIGRATLGFFPANLRDAIAVGAVDHLDAKASFSNFGSKTDVVAPGGGDADLSGGIYGPERSILSLRAAGAGSAMTGSGQLVVGTSYLRQAGTSMAAPYVSAVAALILSLHPEYGPEQVRQALRASADDVEAAGWDAVTGSGRLNARRALDEATPLSVRLTNPVTSIAALTQADVRGTVAGADLAGWTLEYGPGNAPTSWTTINASTSPVTAGVLAAWDTQGVPDGVVTLRLVAQTRAGRTYEDRMEVLIDSVSIASPAPDQAPFVGGGSTVTVTGTVAPAGFQSFTIVVFDLARQVYLPNPRITLAGSGQQSVVNGTLGAWDTTGVEPGHYRVEVRVVLVDGTMLTKTTKVIVDPTLHQGWPRILDNGAPSTYAVLDHLTAIDVDGNGAKDLLIGYGTSVNVLDHTGRSLAGWPQSVDPTAQGALVQNGPAAGDLDGDGSPEIAAINNLGNVFVWDASGALRPGWPRRLHTGGGSVVIEDLDGDGRPEIVTASNNLGVWDANGVARPGWPRNVLGALLAPPAIGDLDGNGTREIVTVQASPRRLVVYGSDGAILSGWPQNFDPTGTSSWSPAAPALADLDGDGKLEIVIGSADGRMLAFHSNGAPLLGWPQATKSAALNSAAIGDIDGDGQLEVVAGTDRVREADGTYSNYLYAWHANGTLLPGWPVRYDRRASATFFGYGAPALADVDGDGRADVLVSSDVDASAPFALNSYRYDGTPVASFPKPTLGVGSGAGNAAAVADLDGDGRLEVAFIDVTHRLYVWDVAGGSQAPAPWAMFRHDSRHTGATRPADRHRIQGRIQDEAGQPLSNVSATLSGSLERTTTTDATGAYSFTGLPAGGNYAVTPAFAGRVFAPQSRTWSGLAADQSGDFVGSQALPVVAVTAPTGTLIAGVPASIRWTATNATAFDVLVSTDAGASYVAVSGCTGLPATQTSCTWTAPGPAAPQARIRVVGRSTSALTGWGEAIVAIITPVVSVTAPNTATNWAINSVQSITWTHNLGAGSSVRIDLSRDGGQTWATLAAAVPNSGTASGQYDWTVSGALSASCRIRVVFLANPAASDVSDVNFTIANPFLTLTSPVRKDTWTIGTTALITWTANLGPLARLRVELSRDGGKVWSILDPGAANWTTPGSVSWTVSGPSTRRAVVRIASTSQATLTDSSVAFTIE
jgi:subtilisin family serine protease